MTRLAVAGPFTAAHTNNATDLATCVPYNNPDPAITHSATAVNNSNNNIKPITTQTCDLFKNKIIRRQRRSWRDNHTTSGWCKQPSSPPATTAVSTLTTGRHWWLALLVLAALPSWSEAVINTGNPDAKRLYDDLLSNYNKLVRPVHNTSDPLTVRKKIYTKIHEYFHTCIP